MWKSLFFLLIALPLNAQVLKNWSPTFITDFGGLDTQNDTSKVSDSDSPDDQNVLTDHGFLEKRPGNVKLQTIDVGFPIKALFEFVNSANTRFLIAHASNTVFSTNFSSNAVTVTTVAASSDIDCTVFLNKIICDDGSVAMFSYDGATYSQVGVQAPICNYLTSAYNRLWCGAPTSDLSQVAVSSFASTTVWAPANTTPLPPQSATSFEFGQNDGDQILCMKAVPWGIFVGKRNSSSIIKGTDVNTFYIKVIDPVVGCVDQRSVQVINGVLTWASQMGVYQWEGNGPAKWISQEIDPTYKSIRLLNANLNFWNHSSPADWQSGTITNNPPTKNTWDAVDNPGTIFPSSTVFIINSSVTFEAGASSMTNISTSDFVTAISLTSTTFQENWFGLTQGINYNATQNIIGQLYWTVQNGTFRNSSVLGNTTLTAFPNSSSGSEIKTSSVAISSGSWKWTYYYGNSQASNTCADSGQSNTCFINKFIFKDANNSYQIQYDDNPIALKLIKTVGGTSTVLFSSASTLYYQTPYNFEVQRSTDGRTYLYNNSVLVGSATDTSVTSSSALDLTDYGCQTCRGVAGLNYNNHFYNFYAYQYAKTGVYISSGFDTMFSTPVFGSFSSTYTVGNGEGYVNFYTEVSTSPNNDVFDTIVAATNTVSSAAKRFIKIEADLGTYISTTTPQVSGLNILAVTTGVYTSPVHFIGNAITAWRVLNITDSQQTPGTVAYSIRAATWAFPSNTTIPWTPQPNNQIPSISTGSYVQFKVDSSSITSSSETASVTRFILNWQEGSSVRPASGFNQQRYLLSVNISTNNTVNDTILVYQRNKKWTKFSGPSIAAMSPFNFQLIGGSGNIDSTVWKLMQDGIYDDDGAPIDAYWRTKDFILGDPFLQKTFYDLWVDSLFVSSGTAQISYSVNKNPVFNTTIINVDNSGSNSKNKSTPYTAYQDVLFPLLPDRGNYLRLKFENSQNYTPFQINSFLFHTDLQPRQAQ